MVSSTSLKMVGKKKTTTLRILDKYRINSIDLRKKIWKDIFISKKEVETLFARRGLSEYDKPDKWDWEYIDHILDVHYGGLCRFSKTGFSVSWSESRWLREACLLLGIKYFDGGPSDKQYYRKVRIAIPPDWVFDPNKEVHRLSRCESCDYEFNSRADEVMELDFFSI